MYISLLYRNFVNFLRSALWVEKSDCQRVPYQPLETISIRSSHNGSVLMAIKKSEVISFRTPTSPNKAAFILIN